VANNNQIYKMSNAGGFKSLNRYYDMLAGNTVWNPWSPDGAFDALATVTLSAAASTITFSGIPSTYKHLQIRGLQKMTTATRWSWVQFNGDAGSNQYTYHSLQGNGSSASAAGSSFATTYGRVTLADPQFGGAIFDILDYANTSKIKVIRSLWGTDLNGSGYVGINSSAWNSTAAITSITIGCEGADTYTQNSQFTLYGVK
jgi:hypothetical protein